MYGTARYGIEPYGEGASAFVTFEEWTETGGGNHLGDDWFITQDTTLGGVHTHVGRLVLAAGVLVTVFPYDPTDAPQGGLLTIECVDAEIIGTIWGDGAGFGAGGAGGGGSGLGGLGGLGSAGVQGGSPGVNGSNAVAGVGGNGGAAAGSWGGAGGVAGAGTGGAGGAGGYLGAGINGDSSADLSVVRGSGGGGGAGGKGGATYGGGGGGHGAPGGAAISILALSRLLCSGSISANGLAAAGLGVAGQLWGGAGALYDPLALSSAGGAALGGSFAGGAGGAGAGGGIVLYCPGPYGLITTGAVLSSLSGSSTTGGGTVKLLRRIAVGAPTVSSGRLLSGGVVSGVPIQYRGFS